MNCKKLRLGIATGLIFLVGEVYFLLIHVDEQGIFLTLMCGFAAAISSIRYGIEYDRKLKPKHWIEQGLPHYEEGQPDLNVYAFNFWKWIILTFAGGMFLIIGTYRNL